jgi:hypothetical protein
MNDRSACVLHGGECRVAGLRLLEMWRNLLPRKTHSRCVDPAQDIRANPWL